MSERDLERSIDITSLCKREVCSTSFLTQEREKELEGRIRRSEDTDNEAFHELVTANLQLVASLVRRHAGRFNLDLFQAGCIGLIQSVRRFDPEKGRVTTNAVQDIRREVIRASWEDRLVRVPTPTSELTQQVLRIYPSGETSLEETGREIGLTESQIGLVKSDLNTQYIDSLEKPLGEEDDFCLADTLVDESADLEYEHIDSQIDIANLLNCLDERRREIVELKFGIGYGGKERTNREIAGKINKNQSRVDQLYQEALKILRQKLNG